MTVFKLLAAAVCAVPVLAFGAPKSKNSARPQVRPLGLTEFKAALDKQMAKMNSTTTAAIHVEVLGSGKVLYSQNASTGLVPASLSKVLTTSAALERLGPGFTFKTRVIQQDNGDLILAGNGDPYLVSERLYDLAKQVAATGLKHVREIRIDNSAFEQDYLGLQDFNQHNGSIDGPTVSATSFNFNLLHMYVTPNSTGSASIELDPPGSGYPVIQNSIQQIKGSGDDVDLVPGGVLGDRQVFEAKGSIGKSAGRREENIAVANPESQLAYAFSAILRGMGISVDRDFDGVIHNAADAAGTLIAEQSSLPLSDLAGLYMATSNNFMAEQVFQAFGASVMGAPASIDKSRAAMRVFLSRSADCHGSQIDNGSGLTWLNLVSASCFIQVVQELSPPSLAAFIASLPVGDKSGTLSHRFKNPPPGFDASKVHAKTGTLWSRAIVTGLVGATQISSGETVLFAILENDTRSDESLVHGFKDWEDAGVEIIQLLDMNH